MRKYYLFLIKRDVYDLYHNHSYSLYKTLENLYHLKGTNFTYGLSLYDQLCDVFDVSLLTHYLYHKKGMVRASQYFYYEDEQEVTKIYLGYATTILYTNKNFPKCFDIFYCYHKRIFLCDFENEDFFWLNKQYHKRDIYEYN